MTAFEMQPLGGDVVVVTGANSGLGYEGTKAFFRNGATVVMACRSTERGTEAADAIRQESNSVWEGEGALDVRECDLADLASVRSFAEAVGEAYDAVDVLCNNAGLMAIPRRETDDGFEMQLGVNHLGHFALTGHLFEQLVASDEEARAVTHSSSLHTRGEMDFDDLNWELSYDKWDAYGRSKLANLLFAYELQRRIEDSDVTGVTSVACHPGYADTNLQARTAAASRNPLATPLMWIGNKLLAQSAEKGALPMLYAATADVDGGAFVAPGGFMNMRGSPEEQRSSEASYDEDDAATLWEYSRDATGVEYPL